MSPRTMPITPEQRARDGRPGHGIEMIMMDHRQPKKIIASRCLRAASADFRILTRAT